MAKRSGFWGALLSALGVAVFSSAAVASSTPCSSVYSTYQTCVGGGSCSPHASPAEIIASYPYCFPGGAANSQVSVSASSFQQVGAISGSLSSRILSESGPMGVALGPQKGIAAGGKSAWNLWANVAQNTTRQSYTVGTNAIRNGLDVTNMVAGLDYAMSPSLVLGVSAAMDRGSVNSQPFGASASTTKGNALAPYLGYQISKELALDVTLGVGSGKTSSTGNTESEADRLFYAANLSYAQWFKELQVTGKLGFLHGEEDFGLAKQNGAAQANTAAKNKLDRLQFGGQVGYWMGNGMQPYAGLSYMTDRRSSSAAGVDAVGKGAWQWALGVNFFSLAKGMTGGIAYQQEEGRSNQKSNAFTANISLRY